MKTLETLTVASSRRGMLKAALSGGFVLAFRLPSHAVNEPEQAADPTDGKFAPDAFIRIDHTGTTTLVMPQVEMGQGVYTALPMILIDELDGDWERVALEHASPNEALYANPMLGVQATGNSNSVRAFWKPLRTAAATARAMLIQAAAEQWQVEPASCTASKGVVIHAASGRALSYGDLADAASKLPVPQQVPLKDPKDFTLIGKPLKRLDTPNKSDGKVVYGIDAMLPGMKFATLSASPVLGGKVARVDNTTAAKAVPGVRQIIVLDDLVAVVGDHMWAAKQGLEALAITWDDGPNGKVNSVDIWDNLREASKKDGAVAKNIGDVAKALSQDERIDADYEMPFLAHATMEPMNCTVHVTPNSCEIWIGSQVVAQAGGDQAGETWLSPALASGARVHDLPFVLACAEE